MLKQLFAFVRINNAKYFHVTAPYLINQIFSLYKPEQKTLIYIIFIQFCPLQSVLYFIIRLMINKIQNWKISTQVCCYASILIIISSTFSFICCYMLISMTIGQFNQGFYSMFQRTSIKQITNFVQLQKNLTNNYFEDKMEKIIKMNTIFHFIQKDDFRIVDPFSCFDNTELLKNKQLISSVFCGGHTNKDVPPSTGIENEYFEKYTSLLTSIYMMYNFNSPFYTSLSNDAYFGIIDLVVKPSSQKPQSIHIRSWYQEHIKQMNSGQLILQSTPYFSRDKYVSFTLSANLTNLNGSMIGVIAQNQELSQIPTFSKTNIKFQMANDQNQLMISPHYQLGQTIIYNISQENVTGINSNQWNIWKQQVNISNQYYIEQMDNNLIAIIRLTNPLSYVILEIDNSLEINQQKQLLNIIIELSAIILQIIILIFFGSMLIVLALQYCSISLIQRDIKDIMKITQVKVSLQYFIFLRQQIKIKNSNIAYKLHQAYSRLNANLIKSMFKNNQCKKLENIKYPQQDERIFQHINYIWNQTHLLHNKPKSRFNSINIIKIFQLKKQSQRMQYLLSRFY